MPLFYDRPMNTEPIDPVQSIYTSISPATEVLFTVNEHTPLLLRGTEDEEIHSENVEISMFWEELHTILRYTLPIFATHVLEYSLVFVSVISMGHLSTNALAAVSLGSMTATVTGHSIIRGLASALDTMLPSAWTSSQPRLVGLWTQRMGVVIAISLIPIYIIWFNAEHILLLLKQDPEIAHLAALYLRWMSLELPAYAFNIMSRKYFQCQGSFTVPTRIILVVAPINALLNYTLVWGPDSVRLGFIGAPIASVVSSNLASVISLLYGIYYIPRTAWHPLHRRMFSDLGILVRLGLSGIGQVASEWWAWEFVALAASFLGPVALASQLVLLVSSITTCQVPYSLASATSIRVGNLLGEKKAKRAGVAACTSMVIASVLSCITSAAYLIFRHSWAYMFNNDPEVVTLVASVIPLLALYQVFDGNSVVIGSILRARGKQFIGTVLNVSAYYVIGLPLGIWLAFSRGLGLHGMWIGLTISLAYCAAVGTWLCIRTDWDHEVIKVTERLRGEEKAQKIVDEETGPVTI